MVSRLCDVCGVINLAILIVFLFFNLFDKLFQCTLTSRIPQKKKERKVGGFSDN